MTEEEDDGSNQHQSSYVTSSNASGGPAGRPSRGGGMALGGPARRMLTYHYLRWRFSGTLRGGPTRTPSAASSGRKRAVLRRRPRGRFLPGGDGGERVRRTSERKRGHRSFPRARPSIRRLRVVCRARGEDHGKLLFIRFGQPGPGSARRGEGSRKPSERGLAGVPGGFVWGMRGAL